MHLYKLTFANGKIYIGQTVKTVEHRFNHHRNTANAGSVLPVHAAWRKYGEPTCELIGSYLSHTALNEAEVAAIARFGCMSPNGYNIALGGHDGTAKSHLVRAKMSAAKMGKTLTAEAKAKLADASAKNWTNPVYREKVRAGIAASFTEERRAAIAEHAQRVHTGKIVSEETRAKLRGRVISEETRAKMSAAAKTRIRAPHNDDVRAKIAEGARRSWAAGDVGKTARRREAIRAALKLRHERLTPEERAAFSETRKRAWETRRSAAAKE